MDANWDNQKDFILDFILDVIGSHPWQFVLYCCLLMAAVWWIVMPLTVYALGRPVQARVMETWLTPSEVCVFIQCWQLAGVRLEVVLPDGHTYQVKKYCREDVVFGGRIHRGAQLHAQRLFGRVVLPGVSCDSDQILFIGMVLFFISTYPIWKNLRSDDKNNP
jgi:hypothetical protein